MNALSGAIFLHFQLAQLRERQSGVRSVSLRSFRARAGRVGLNGNATDPSRRIVRRSWARLPLLIPARPFFRSYSGLPPRLPGFMGFGLAIRTAGAIRTASVYDSRTASASGPRGGSKYSTSCRSFRHRVGVVWLLGWRRLLRWRRWLRCWRFLRWWWCLR